MSKQFSRKQKKNLRRKLYRTATKKTEQSQPLTHKHLDFNASLCIVEYDTQFIYSLLLTPSFNFQ